MRMTVINKNDNVNDNDNNSSIDIEGIGTIFNDFFFFLSRNFKHLKHKQKHPS